MPGCDGHIAKARQPQGREPTSRRRLRSALLSSRWPRIGTSGAAWPVPPSCHAFFRLPLLPRLRRALIVVCSAEILSLSCLCVT